MTFETKALKAKFCKELWLNACAELDRHKELLRKSVNHSADLQSELEAVKAELAKADLNNETSQQAFLVNIKDQADRVAELESELSRAVNFGKQHLEYIKELEQQLAAAEGQKQIIEQMADSSIKKLKQENERLLHKVNTECSFGLCYEGTAKLKVAELESQLTIAEKKLTRARTLFVEERRDFCKLNYKKEWAFHTDNGILYYDQELASIGGAE